MTRGIALALLLGVGAVGLSGCAQPQSQTQTQFQSNDPAAFNCIYVYSASCPGPKRWYPIGSGG